MNYRASPSLAIASIPTGLLLPPVGIALGHLARKRIKRSGEQGAGLTLIGLTLGYVTLLGGLAGALFAFRDDIDSALFWVLLGCVIFVAIVAIGMVLARYVPFARVPIVWWLNWLAETSAMVNGSTVNANVSNYFFATSSDNATQQGLAFRRLRIQLSVASPVHVKIWVVAHDESVRDSLPTGRTGAQ